ncbi:hypothetical protein VHEMI09102 [[Torrubiella] hemipterigena]|uniref:Uncharacterized protein n=1 Tax=[Torrubiella] hemipterigena TaxID=1531966 RepID=A0A0A1T8S3_9HYPO|nr:hypothetical protein VHEMI09102 [[Torrubiella] hemipterigena]
MTVLSDMGGTRGLALVYCAKTDLIFIMGFDNPCSYDPILMRKTRFGISDDERAVDDENHDCKRAEDGVDGEYEDEERGEDQQNEHETEPEEEEDDLGEDEEESGQESDEYDDMLGDCEGRDAQTVLRDINRWYQNLAELPGGENSDGMWGMKGTIKALYKKHGWPGETFDGDAFLVDLLRRSICGDGPERDREQGNRTTSPSCQRSQGHRENPY